MKQGNVWVMAWTVVAAMGSVAVAQGVETPLKIGFSKPFGIAQTNSLVTDPQVDGKILRVVVGPAEKSWHAMMNAGIGEKLKQGDRIKATLWLRGTATEAGRKSTVQIGVQEADPPTPSITKAKRVELTDRLAAYTIEATVPRDMPKSKIAVTLQMGFLPQTVDVATIQAVKLPAQGAQ